VLDQPCFNQQVEAKFLAEQMVAQAAPLVETVSKLEGFNDGIVNSTPRQIVASLCCTRMGL
jgi:hypothetical protein